MSLHSRLRRLEAMERELAVDTGLPVFLVLVSIDETWDRPRPIVAIQVGPPNNRQRIERREGETLEQLHARANPKHTWRARPSPIFGATQEM